MRGDNLGPRYAANAQKLYTKNWGCVVLLRLSAPPAVGESGLCPLGEVRLEFLGHFDGSLGKKMEHSGIYQGEGPWEDSAPEFQAQNTQRLLSAATPRLGLGSLTPGGGVRPP